MSAVLCTATANDEDLLRIQQGFEQLSGVPGICGALDGTKVLWETRKLGNIGGQACVDRHGNKSLNIQGLCDSRCIFLDIHVGNSGKVHDACVLTRSKLKERLVLWLQHKLFVFVMS